jgi:hypothetical protein
MHRRPFDDKSLCHSIQKIRNLPQLSKACAKQNLRQPICNFDESSVLAVGG